VPNALTPNEQRDVTIVMRNTGTLPWIIGEGYRLGSQNPQDNVIWGLNRIDIPASVGRFAEVEFEFTITAPAAPGNYNLQWQMLQEGVEWFGEATDNIPINVALPEPPECAGIRADLAEAEAEIAELRGERTGLQADFAAAGPGEKAAIAAQIRALNGRISRVAGRIAELRQRLKDLGCA
jgi:hypothetical protein